MAILINIDDIFAAPHVHITTKLGHIWLEVNVRKNHCYDRKVHK